MPPSNDVVRLKGNLYAQPGFFRTNVATGVTRTPAGARMCALTPDFLVGFRDAVIYESGKAYRRVLKQCGRRWGTQFVRRFDAEVGAHYATPLRDLSAGVVHTCLADAFAAHGWGSLAIDLSDLEAGLIVAEVRQSVMPSVVPESDRPVDLMMAGLLGAVFAHLSGQNLDCVQTDCPSQGADACRFLIGQAARVQEVEAWLTKVPPHEPASHAAAVARFLHPDPPADDAVARTHVIGGATVHDDACCAHADGGAT